MVSLISIEFPSFCDFVHCIAVELRDFFEPGGSMKLCNVLRSRLVSFDDNLELLNVGLVVGKLMSKTEYNKCE